MAKKDLTGKMSNRFEDEIIFDESKFYNKIKEYLNKECRLKAYSGEGYRIFLTRQLKQNSIPYAVVLSRRDVDRFNNPIGAVFIERERPLREQIKEYIKELTRREYN